MNTHLYYGRGITDSTIFHLEKLRESAGISRGQINEILASLRAGEARRCSEVKRLCLWLRDHQYGYDGVIIAGDFNDIPNSKTLKVFSEYGFFDSCKESSFLTFDPLTNVNYKYGKEVGLPWPDFGSTLVKKFLIEYDSMPRRIDFILLSENLRDKVKSAQLFGNDLGKGDLMGSDHYGISLEIDL